MYLDTDLNFEGATTFSTGAELRLDGTTVVEPSVSLGWDVTGDAHDLTAWLTVSNEDEEAFYVGGATDADLDPANTLISSGWEVRLGGEIVLEPGVSVNLDLSGATNDVASYVHVTNSGEESFHANMAADADVDLEGASTMSSVGEVRVGGETVLQPGISLSLDFSGATNDVTSYVHVTEDSVESFHANMAADADVDLEGASTISSVFEVRLDGETYSQPGVSLSLDLSGASNDVTSYPRPRRNLRVSYVAAAAE